PARGRPAPALSAGTGACCLRESRHASLDKAQIGPLNLEMALLEISRASKQFGATSAVDEVSLTVERGALFALLGPSGCGKTTLLRMIAGFETPDSGRIVIDGVEVTGLPPYARPVNMMFQSYALFPHLD